MKSEPQMGSIAFTFWVPLVPWEGDVENYITKFEGKIRVWADGSSDTPDLTAGKVNGLVVKMAEALRAGTSLFWVLDTEEVESLYTPLFEDDGVFHPGLEVEAPYGDMLIIEDIQLRKRFDSPRFREQVVETAIATFATVGVVVLKTELLQLNEEELIERGYWELILDGWAMRDNFRFHN